MKTFLGPFLVAAVLLTPVVGQADDLGAVKAFDSELLSSTAAGNIAERAAKVVVENWVSILTPLGGPDREGFVNMRNRYE